jgi:hypothetical protein
MTKQYMDQSENSDDDASDSLSESSFDDDSFNNGSNSGDQQSNNSSGMNNEMKEIHDLAQEDTRNLRTWRIIIVFILLGTFVGVITGTILIVNGQSDTDTEEAVCIHFSNSSPYETLIAILLTTFFVFSFAFT